MFIPWSSDVEGFEPRCAYPIANLALIAFTSLISVQVLRGALDPEAVMHLVLQRGGDSDPVQLVTHAFLHGSLGHLLGNMICLLAFGNVLNRRLGHLRYTALYLGLCVAGGLSWSFFGNGQGVIGASGAVCGLAGLYLAFSPTLRMNVLVSVLGLVVLATSYAALVLFDGGGTTLFAIVAVAVAYTLWSLKDAALTVGGPREGFVLRLLGFRTVSLAGWVLVPLLLAQDVIAMVWGSADAVAHSAHLGGAFVGLLVALGLTGYGTVRGSAQVPTLLEWVGLQTPAPTHPPNRRLSQPRPAGRTRPTARPQLSFSDWQRQRQENPPTEQPTRSARVEQWAGAGTWP